MNSLRILPIAEYAVAGDEGTKKGEVGKFPVGDVRGRDVSVWLAVAAVLGERSASAQPSITSTSSHRHRRKDGKMTKGMRANKDSHDQ